MMHTRALSAIAVLTVCAAAVAIFVASKPREAVAPPTEVGSAPVPSATSTPSAGYDNAYPHLIQIASPTAGAEVSSTSPIVVSGAAKGSWYFEGSFPVIVVDWDGRIIGEGSATAQGDWMVSGFVPFSGEIRFTTPEHGTRGAVIFHNDNPSGDPAKDKAVEVPIEFY